MAEEDKELEIALDQALEGEPRAEELRSMREVLEARLAALRKELAAAENSQERKSLEREARALQKQIAALKEGEAVNEFVEGEVKFALRAQRLWGEVDE